jgi:uncharacterized protein (TIGR02453 family)
MSIIPAMKKRRFEGFPKEGVRFLRSLKRNNKREWFEARKQTYLDQVKAPMEAFIVSMAEEFRSLAPELLATPKASSYRIYRDTRFSPDKTPYKTQVAAVFPPRGLGKHEGACLYVHIAPDEVFVGGGLYMPTRPDLQAVREHLASEHRRFRSSIRSRSFRDMFGELGGEKLTRVPRDFHWTIRRQTSFATSSF